MDASTTPLFPLPNSSKVIWRWSVTVSFGGLRTQTEREKKHHCLNSSGHQFRSKKNNSPISTKHKNIFKNGLLSNIPFTSKVYLFGNMLNKSLIKRLFYGRVKMVSSHFYCWKARERNWEEGWGKAIQIKKKPEHSQAVLDVRS